MNAITYTIIYMPERKLVKSEILAFAVLAALYLILMGSIVSKSVAKEQFKSELAVELRNTQEAESVLAVQGGGITQFTEYGYEEPRALEVIKRRRNVAENSRASFY